jgi:hypothetical protein
MAHYSTPGVYPQELFLRPSVEQPTGVPAFVGLISAAEANAAGAALQPLAAGAWRVVAPPETAASIGGVAPLTLWPQFAERFKAAAGYGYLAQAVYGFFLNGGRLCYPLLACYDDGVAPAAALEAALGILEANDAIDLVCAPDIMRWPDLGSVQIMQTIVLDHCARLGDRFAILDALPQAGPDRVLDQAQALNSASGALYFPWLDIGLRTTAQRDQPIYVPPCGHIAGIYARSDAQDGVHKAPANQIVEGALDLQINLADSQQAQLNDRQVNCLRSFSGRGIRVWGARTLSQDPAWTYVNARRLFLAAARGIQRSLADVAFEPNDPLLWARIERELNGYFNTLFQRGALHGATPEEAFYVRCDASTNQHDSRDRGEVVTEIGLAPSLPNEFVVVRIIHGASGVTTAGPRLPG